MTTANPARPQARSRKCCTRWPNLPNLRRKTTPKPAPLPRVRTVSLSQVQTATPFATWMTFYSELTQQPTSGPALTNSITQEWRGAPGLTSRGDFRLVIRETGFIW